MLDKTLIRLIFDCRIDRETKFGLFVSTLNHLPHIGSVLSQIETA